MNEIDIVSVLSQGTIGLSFLLSLLSYKLIRNTQKIKSNNGINTSKPVYAFMAMTFLFLISSIYENTVKIDNDNFNDIRQRLQAVCKQIRTTEWLKNNDEARRSLSKECP